MQIGGRRTVETLMKKILFLIGGVCAAAVGFLALGAGSLPKMHRMSRQPKTAWADSPTVV